jgi:hypothetical protein
MTDPDHTAPSPSDPLPPPAPESARTSYRDAVALGLALLALTAAVWLALPAVRP